MKMRELTPLLNVMDVHRSIGFYEKFLGFKVKTLWEDGDNAWASLERPGIKLMINGKTIKDRELGRRGRERSKRRTYSDAVFYFYIDDVEPLHTELKQSGYKVSEIEDEFYGVRDFFVRDPDGYELGFAAPLKRKKVAKKKFAKKKTEKHKVGKKKRGVK